MPSLSSRPRIAGGALCGSLLALTAATGNGYHVRDARIDELTNRIAILESRLASTPASGPSAPLTVKAPFTVVDNQGSPILEVQTNNSTTNGFVLHSRSGETAIAVSATKNANFIKIQDESKKRVVLLMADDTAASIGAKMGDSAGSKILLHARQGGKHLLEVFNESAKTVAEIGLGPGDGGFFKANNPDGSRIAVMGIASNNSVVALKDGAESERLSMVLTAAGLPALTVRGAGQKVIGVFGQGAKGAGALQLFAPDERTMVEAGYTGSVGIVRTGPTFKCAGTLGLAAPDCIMGHP